MKLAWILWLASIAPQPVAEQVCLATAIYLEARSEPEPGQFAVAEVALRRRDSHLYGDTVCEVVTQRRQFAPTLVSPDYRLRNQQAWQRSFDIAGIALGGWTLAEEERSQAAPSATHFVALAKASPNWAQGEPVTTIGEHSFFLVGL